MKRVTSILLSLFLCIGVFNTPMIASDYATPDYEVKYYLSPDLVLGSDSKLTDEVLDAFDMPSSVLKMNVQYLDTDDLDLSEEGWACRIRKKEDKSKFELTYKKRYPIVGGDIEAALAQAAADGFDAGEEDYEAQIDWGYNKQTLSFSRKKKFKNKDYDGMTLPDLKDSADEAIDRAPGKFEDWSSKNWGTDTLEDARIYGVVKAKRSIGEFEGKEVYIEVWKIKEATGDDYEYIVEISFKEDDYDEASDLRDELKAYLESEGWLLNTDVLKTSMILDRY